MSCAAKRRLAVVKLDTLTQAIFIDMFGDPVVNRTCGWPEDPVLGDVADDSRSGSGATPRGAKGGLQGDAGHLD